MADSEKLPKLIAREGLDAFAPIVRASSARLFRLAIRLLADRSEAEDAVQEGFLRAYHAICAGRYDERVRMEAWLRTIVTRVALDMLRGRKVERALVEPIDPTRVASPAATGDEVDALIELDQWLGVLPIDQRAAVVLKYLEGLTSAEVAEALGVSEGAIEQRLIRARATLKRRMDDDGV